MDNGDTIQGTALADYEATISPIPCTQQLSMYKAMGALGFDAGTLGNHEFNYGLPFPEPGAGRWAGRGRLDPTKMRRRGLPAIAGQRVQQQDQETAGAAYTLLERTLVARAPMAAK